MRFLQCNIQSLNTSLQLLRQCVQRLDVDIIALQETWHPSDGYINIKNFTQQFLKLRSGKEGGGVALFTHRRVKAVRLKEYETDDIEAVWADVKCGKVRTVVGSVYIPPGDISALDKLDKIIGRILSTHDKLVLCMDANSRSTLWDDACVGVTTGQKSIRMGRRLEDIIDTHLLNVHNDGSPTYVSGAWATSLDVTLSTGIMQYGKASWSVISDDLNTPHEGIMFDIGERIPVSRREIIDWSNFDWLAYNSKTHDKLGSLRDRWFDGCKLNSDDMVQQLTECIQECIESVAVKKVVSSHSKPWIDKVISEKLKELRVVRKKCQVRKSKLNLENYTKVRDETIAMLKKAEDQWWLTECEKLEEADERQKWKIIGRLTNQVMATTVQPLRRTTDKGVEYVFENDEIRQELEDYHIHRTYACEQKPDEKVIRVVDQLVQEAKEGKGDALMNANVSEYEVKCTFGIGSDTPGPDGISAKLIDKADRNLMQECLVILWNKAWSDGYFVADWKKENRVIIPKPGKDDYNECNAYRTVSVTDCIGKRFEYVTAQRLALVLDSVGFDNAQFAYLRNRSATQASMMLVEKVKKALINGEKVGVVFFDFTDAFGSVNRTRLLEKLGVDFGISGKLFLHIKSFLDDRYARLKIDGIVGEWIESLVGTSAGTRLGPLLFITYVHDVPRCISPKFADDLAAVAVGDDIDAVKEQLQTAVDQLVDWSKQENMMLNVSKTKVMMFGDSVEEVKILVDGKLLDQVFSYKYLGIMLDPKLDFGLQVDYAVSKAKRASAKVFGLIDGRRGVPVQIGINLYKALIRPHMEYSIPVWANINDKDLHKLEEVQLNSIKRIIGAKAHSSSAAVEVVSGICPVGIRKRDLCCREYIRIVSSGESHSLVQLLKCTKRVGLRFCPLEYLRVMSREIERKLQGFKLERFQTVKAECFGRSNNIVQMDFQDVIINAAELNTGQVSMSEYNTRINCDLVALSRKQVCVFTDGSVYSGRIGCGACSAAVLLPEKEEGDDFAIKTRAVGVKVSSEQCEIEGIALGIEVALQCFAEKHVEGHGGCVYIFCDCQKAIDVLTQHHVLIKHPEVCVKVKHLGDLLKAKSCIAGLVKIQGHTGIVGNERADMEAKMAARSIVNGKMDAPTNISIADAYKMSADIAQTSWQRRWDGGSKGRHTYEFIPEVNTKILWPRKRQVGVAYCRILLHDTVKCRCI